MSVKHGLWEAKIDIGFYVYKKNRGSKVKLVDRVSNEEVNHNKGK